MPEQRGGAKKDILLGNSQATMQQALDAMVNMTYRITQSEGNTQTIIPFLSITRHSREIPITPSIMNPAFSIMLQGTKAFQLGSESIHLNAGDFAASIIDMPISVQVKGVSEELPAISLRLDFTASEIASVVTDADIKFNEKNKKLYLGAFVGETDADLQGLFIKLLELIDRPRYAPYLAELTKREILYHLLSGEYGYLFFQQLLVNRKSDGVGQAIEWIRKNFTRTFTVEDLAKSNNMSVSGLHHKFKSVTSMGPLQYQKELRLREARRLMLSERMDVTTAAMEVGYESSSQFTREYKRLFGKPPFKDIRALRKSSVNGTF